MQDTTDKQDGSDKDVKQKHVGDKTPNPLPTDEKSSQRAAGEDSQSDPESDSPVD